MTKRKKRSKYEQLVFLLMSYGVLKGRWADELIAKMVKQKLVKLIKK